MTARESRAAAAAGAGGSAAANPIMQIRRGRGLGRGGGFALSGSGIWEKFTRAEGAGTPGRAARTAPSWVNAGQSVGPGEKPKVEHDSTETSQPPFSRHTITQEKLHARAHNNPGTQAHTHTLVHNHPPKPQYIGRHAHTHTGSVSITYKPDHNCSHTQETLTHGHRSMHRHSHRLTVCSDVVPPCIPAETPVDIGLDVSHTRAHADIWPGAQPPPVLSYRPPCPSPQEGP